MTHPTDKLTLANNVTLYLTPCPGTKAMDLTQTIAQFAQQGIKALISLTPKDEMEKHGVTSLPQICANHGITWFYAPVDDFQAPAEAFQKEWPLCKEKVHEFLNDNQPVALHCHGGQGRTGTVAAQILIERGYSFEQAKAEIKAVKPGALTNEKQVSYLQAL